MNKIQRLYTHVFTDESTKLSTTKLAAVIGTVLAVHTYVDIWWLGKDYSAGLLQFTLEMIFALLGVRGFQRVGEMVSGGVISRRAKTAEIKTEAKVDTLRLTPKVDTQKRPAVKIPAIKPVSTPQVVGDLTPNFSWSEFESHDGAEMPLQVKRNIKVLAKRLEVIREAAGNRTITITSGYRSPAHNKAVEGEPKSKHLLGMAADIKIKGMDPSAVADLIESLIAQGKIADGGLGRYPSFTHYDISTPRRWRRTK